MRDAKYWASVVHELCAMPHEAGWVRCVDASPDGRWVVTGGSDRRLKLWAWADGKPAAQPTHDVRRSGGP
jgi:WD40 repeat protein